MASHGTIGAAELLARTRDGVLLYGLTPPRATTTPEQADAVAAAALSRLRSVKVDGLILYDVDAEADRGSAPRPFPFMPMMDPAVFLERHLACWAGPAVVYRAVSKYTEDELDRWLSGTHRDRVLTVLVGAASRHQVVRDEPPSQERGLATLPSTAPAAGDLPPLRRRDAHARRPGPGHRQTVLPDPRPQALPGVPRPAQGPTRPLARREALPDLRQLLPHRRPAVRAWCADNRVELVFLPTYGSWLNWIEAEFAALRYFALNGTDHRSHAGQNAAIASNVRWRNTRAQPKVNFATDSPIRTWTNYPAKLHDKPLGVVPSCVVDARDRWLAAERGV